MSRLVCLWCLLQHSSSAGPSRCHTGTTGVLTLSFLSGHHFSVDQDEVFFVPGLCPPLPTALGFLLSFYPSGTFSKISQHLLEWPLHPGPSPGYFCGALPHPLGAVIQLRLSWASTAICGAPSLLGPFLQVELCVLHVITGCPAHSEVPWEQVRCCWDPAAFKTGCGTSSCLGAEPRPRVECPAQEATLPSLSAPHPGLPPAFWFTVEFHIPNPRATGIDSGLQPRGPENPGK